MIFKIYSQSVVVILGRHLVSGYPLHRENRENDQIKFPVRENTGNLEILPKHRENTENLFFPSCNFPDYKGKRYFDICCENLKFF